MEQGFTLLEVLVAVAITGVIGLGLWQTLHGVMQTRERIETVSTQFEQLRQTFTQLERDVLQVVNRPVRDQYGDFLPALTTRVDGYGVQLTRQGWRNPLATRRSNQQRVAWALHGSELVRTDWPVLDQGQTDHGVDAVTLEGVEAFTFEVLDGGRWRTQWPTDVALAGQGAGERPEFGFPAAVRVHIEHERFGPVTRVWSLPDAVPFQVFTGGADNDEDNDQRQEQVQ
ncbi:MAG: general secretion pathway protein J [Marinobacter sp. T13-3]|nr:MAG: general secretion pathway protein J [Marinobacter sp. T13-3]